MSIAALQDELLKMPQYIPIMGHHFTDGLYCREMEILEGAVIVGAKHKTNHFFMLAKGECIIAIEEDKIKVKAPYLCVTKAGDKRAIHALEDSIILTFHSTEETDPMKIAEEITEPEDGITPMWKLEEVSPCRIM